MNMELRRTRERLPRVEWRESSPSTNEELRDLARRAKEESAVLPSGTLLVTSNQTAGRGRAGRGWVTPPETAIAASLYIRGFGQGAGAPGALGFSWLPLIAGSAMTAALQPCFPADSGLRVGVKWPNDVHVRNEGDAVAGRPGKKLCGILCELLENGDVIVGTGINLLIPEEELPTDRATSLLAAESEMEMVGEGAGFERVPSLADPVGQRLADEVLARYADEFLRLVELARASPGAARTRVLRDSLTIGAEVRAHLPGGEIVDGFAHALAADGSLMIDRPTTGRLTISAGDVEHLR